MQAESTVCARAFLDTEIWRFRCSLANARTHKRAHRRCAKGQWGDREDTGHTLRWWRRASARVFAGRPRTRTERKTTARAARTLNTEHRNSETQSEKHGESKIKEHTAQVRNVVVGVVVVGFQMLCLELFKLSARWISRIYFYYFNSPQTPNQIYFFPSAQLPIDQRALSIQIKVMRDRRGCLFARRSRRRVASSFICDRLQPGQRHKV